MSLTEGAKVRSVNDGQLGTLVTTDDGLCVRLDRGIHEHLVPYHPHAWVEAKRAALSPMQIARVQHAADCALRRALGDYRVVDWESLTDEKKIAFMARGPEVGDQDARRFLFKAIVTVLQ